MDEKLQEPEPTAEQRARWFAKALELTPEELEQMLTAPVETRILYLSSDAGGDGITAETCGRYLVLQSNNLGEICCYDADTAADFEAMLHRLIDASSAGEDYGWTIDDLYDLETGKEMRYTFRVEVHATEDPR